MKCARHPDIETNLRCSKCGKPICPKCMVQTPVGARCRECGRRQKIPTYSVSIRHYLIATATALGMALVCGLIWGVVGGLVSFFYFNLLLGAGIGYATGEAVGLAVNRKRGAGLATIAGISVALSYFISNAALFGGGRLALGIL